VIINLSYSATTGNAKRTDEGKMDISIKMGQGK
jgi:hypothetical protein